ncbi:hypothetical protein G7Y89_g14047 [Cudoniella acicularis]|uniref:Cytochrome P450 n=1 Tax=Cudoniella acicularis TaxID=354080 RepID=A0A8H4R8L2_9HELO|nr:hypothetical protein G7Y89_g14047 [Cudoniella acicularis]
MKSHSDFNGWIYSFKTITGFAAILGQIPEVCPFTLGNDTVMSFLRRFQTFPDPTQQFIVEIEKQILKHDSEHHTCGKSFICEVLSGRSTSKDQESEHAEATNILFETFFAAAAEIAVTLGTVFYCLLTNFDAYERLVAILRAPTWPKSLELTPEKAAYLESLRLYPSYSPPMERIVPSQGIEAGGYHIPAGNIVSVPQYMAHRDVSIFGEDIEVFRPERWFEADESSLRRMENNFLAFGKGTGVCVGRDLAMLEIRSCLFGLLQRFDFELVSKKPLPRITMYWMLDHVNFKVCLSHACK